MGPVSLLQKVCAGLFVLLTTGVWLFFSIILSGDEIGREYHLYLYQSVRGLAPSSLVCYNGIPVGKVKSIRNDFERKEVQVNIVITEPDVKIYDDVTIPARKGHLFELPDHYREELDHGNVSDSLKLEFSRNGHPFYLNPNLIIKEPGQEWIIDDNQKYLYVIRAMEDKLFVYARGTRAILVTYLFTGLQYIDLIGGHQDNPVLKEGSEIPTVQNDLGTRFNETLSDLRKKVDRILTDDNLQHFSNIIANIDQLTYNANQNLFSQDPDSIINSLRKILANAEKISGKESREQIQKILDNVATLSSPEKLGIEKLLQRLEAKSSELMNTSNQLVAKLSAIVNSNGKQPDIASVIKKVDHILHDNQQEIRQLIANVEALSAELNQQIEALSKGAQITIQTLNHFLQKELYQTNMEIRMAFKELSSVLRILKAKPNALLWGANVKGKR